MAVNKPSPAKRSRVRLWTAIVILFCLPPVVFAVLLTLLATGVNGMTPVNLLPVFFFGGYCIIEIGFLPAVVATVRGREATSPERTLTMWLFLVLGLLVWSSMPVLLLLDGSGILELFKEPVSTRARRYRFSPAWLAFITWSLTALGVYGLVRHVRRRRLSATNAARMEEPRESE